MQLSESTTVAITGAGSGMGAAMARAFAKRGCTVVVADVVEATAKAVADEITEAGGTAYAEIVDVSSQEAVDEWAARTFDRLGHVDVLCANAGVSLRPFRTTWNASLDDYRWLASINYFGFVHCIRSFVPRMLQQAGRRQIVLTASVDALQFHPGHGPYGATKGAVTTLADVLRYELYEEDPDFGVTTLYPGAVHTNIAKTEALRPAETRSSERAVVAYESTFPVPYFVRFPVEADVVGELVIAGVEKDSQAILTYPYEYSGHDERGEVLRSGDPMRLFEGRP
ncbi:SDR family oxidoreductase [Agromyces sp. NPDC049794]|uniref:SDR family NAD(P)-dependent oxidoreductase n=1 Tax=unclassified Agromyces TaxID=2639701 RepID=UPI0033D17DA9